jgi:hypothetical protein
MKSPDPNTLGHDEEHWPIHDTQPQPRSPSFRIPFDAPPVPLSPTPEQLALLESNKQRFSASCSLHETTPSRHHDEPSPTATASSPKMVSTDPPSPKQSSLLSRRRPELRIPQLSLPNIHTIPGPRSAKQTRPSFTSSRDTSISLPAAYRYRRTSSVTSATMDDEILTPATSTSIDNIRRKMSDGESFLGRLIEYELHGNEMEGEDHSQSPEIDFHSARERVIAGSRLCDVLRTLFASNGFPSG